MSTRKFNTRYADLQIVASETTEVPANAAHWAKVEGKTLIHATIKPVFVDDGRGRKEEELAAQIVTIFGRNPDIAEGADPEYFDIDDWQILATNRAHFFVWVSWSARALPEDGIDDEYVCVGQDSETGEPIYKFVGTTQAQEDDAMDRLRGL
jgi:hypothetical protein